MTDRTSATMCQLIERAWGLVTPGERRILGITGPPGAGKSATAAAVAEALGEDAVLVPMDGFQLADAELRRLGRRGHKGAADTFDAAGFAALLRRLRDPAEDTVYAPEFRPEIGEPIAGAICVPRSVPLVVTEGDYLLSDVGEWARLRALLDEVWFLDGDEPDRPARSKADLAVRIVTDGLSSVTAS
jgi:pantothenate kinase